MRRIRKEVYLDLRHDRMLKRRAKQQGVTEADVIREILDRSDGATAPLRRPPDLEAGRKLLAFVRSLATSRPRSRSGSGRAPNRESLYQERIGRWTKS